MRRHSATDITALDKPQQGQKRKRRQSAGERSDAKARASIEAAGWVVTRMVARHVAEKRVYEEDESVTRKFESSFTLEALAKQVVRREQEEAR